MKRIEDWQLPIAELKVAAGSIRQSPIGIGQSLDLKA
jgi:hypothetical protein